MASEGTPRVNPGGIQPCLTLVPPPKSAVEETDLVEFSLKVRAGSAASAPTYKRKVARFAGGTPAEWIEVLEALEEIFAQNSLTSAEDQENIVKTILRGDSLTAFECSIQESRENLENPGRLLPLSVDMISKALKAVSQDVFPHRALAMQKLWMKRHMKKPADMGIRKLAAAVTQMNSKLIRFAGATEADLFSPAELLELLEFSLPPAWRAKFDLAGYIPTKHDKDRLIAEGEQIERHELLTAKSAPTSSKSKAHANVSSKNNSNRNVQASHKGKPKAPPANNSVTNTNQDSSKVGNGGQSFSGRKFRKELYAVSRGKDRIQVIDQYSAVLKRERKRAQKRAASNKKRKAKTQEAKAPGSPSSDSDDDMSVHVMSPAEAKKAQLDHVRKRLMATLERNKKKRQVTFSPEDQLEEEAAFKKQCQGDDSEESESSS